MKVIVIAEAGVNHNGNLKLAKKLIDIAKYAKADYVKFQSFNHNNLVTINAEKANYQKNSNLKETQRDMLKKLQFSKTDYEKIINYCKKKKIKFLSTAFDKENLDYLLKKNIDFIKIPSGEITNLPFLKYISSKNKKILLSTGASTIDEISRALKILKKVQNITIMQCNTAYPTPIKDINLKSLITFKNKFKSKIRLSDHTLSLIPPIIAVALGAVVIEKHFTVSRKLRGPDHKSSLEAKELKKMIENIRESELALGNEGKKVTKSERENRNVIRRSIVANKEIKKGQKFTNYNITSKRPATGISPMLIKKVLGKKSKKNFKIDEIIKL